MKNKICLIILSVFLLTSGIAIAENEVNVPVTANQVNNTVTDTVAQGNNTTVKQKEPQKYTNYKKATSKRKIVKKFLVAMFGVMLSSFLIFFMLTIYNKIHGKLTKKVNTSDDDYSLKSPDDSSEAIKVFLDKTKW